MGNVCNSSANNNELINPNNIDLTHFELLKVVGKGGFVNIKYIYLIIPLLTNIATLCLHFNPNFKY